MDKRVSPCTLPHPDRQTGGPISTRYFKSDQTESIPVDRQRGQPLVTIISLRRHFTWRQFPMPTNGALRDKFQFGFAVKEMTQIRRLCGWKRLRLMLLAN